MDDGRDLISASAALSTGIAARTIATHIAERQ
jgi:hypothetical protein